MLKSITIAAYSLLTIKLGRCPTCMRAAFLAAAFAVAMASLAVALATTPLISVAAVAAAVTLIALWLSHLIAFAARSTMAIPQKVDAVVIGPSPSALAVPMTGTRRRFLSLFMKSLAFAALATMFGARYLRAQGNCNCYTESNCNCPPQFPQCVFNSTTGEAICCGPNANGCAGPTQTWCCAPGHSCHGRERFCY